MGQPAAKANDQVVGRDTHLVLVPAGAASCPRRCPTLSPALLDGGLCSTRHRRRAGRGDCRVRQRPTSPRTCRPRRAPRSSRRRPTGRRSASAARPSRSVDSRRRSSRRHRHDVQRPGRAAGRNRRRGGHRDGGGLSGCRSDDDARHRRRAYRTPPSPAAGCPLDQSPTRGAGSTSASARPDGGCRRPASRPTT